MDRTHRDTNEPSHQQMNLPSPISVESSVSSLSPLSGSSWSLDTPSPASCGSKRPSCGVSSKCSRSKLYTRHIVKRWRAAGRLVRAQAWATRWLQQAGLYTSPPFPEILHQSSRAAIIGWGPHLAQKVQLKRSSAGRLEGLFLFRVAGRGVLSPLAAGTGGLWFRRATVDMMAALQPPVQIPRRATYTTWSVAAQMIEGVCTVHDASVAHMDISPENFLLFIHPTDFDVRLADLEMAFRVHPHSRFRGFRGKPGYAAPEVLASMKNGPAYRPQPADVYSLALTLFVLFTRKNPIPVDSEPAMWYCRHLLETEGIQQLYTRMTKAEDFHHQAAVGTSANKEPMGTLPSELWPLLEAMTETDPNRRVTIHDVRVMFAEARENALLL
jgi:hypothetical protein